MGHAVVITDSEFISRDLEAVLDFLVGRYQFLLGEVVLHMVQHSNLLCRVSPIRPNLLQINLVTDAQAQMGLQRVRFILALVSKPTLLLLV